MEESITTGPNRVASQANGEDSLSLPQPWADLLDRYPWIGHFVKNIGGDLEDGRQEDWGRILYLDMEVGTKGKAFYSPESVCYHGTTKQTEWLD
jgi:hypothetical protein